MALWQFDCSPAPGAAPARFSEKHALAASAQSPLVTSVRGGCFNAALSERRRFPPQQRVLSGSSFSRSATPAPAVDDLDR